MTAHKHAENMRLYSEDAAQTDKPYERWQATATSGGTWHDCSKHPFWDEDREYRRKPRTIRIGERDVPAPMMTAPDIDAHYYIPSIKTLPYYEYRYWFGSEDDILCFKNGICHITKKAAIAHAEALILVSGGTL